MRRRRELSCWPQLPLGTHGGKGYGGHGSKASNLSKGGKGRKGDRAMGKGGQNDLEVAREAAAVLQQRRPWRPCAAAEAAAAEAAAAEAAAFLPEAQCFYRWRPRFAAAAETSHAAREKKTER